MLPLVFPFWHINDHLSCDIQESVDVQIDADDASSGDAPTLLGEKQGQLHWDRISSILEHPNFWGFALPQHSFRFSLMSELYKCRCPKSCARFNCFISVHRLNLPMGTCNFFFLHTHPTALVGSWSILQGVVYQGQQHTWCRTPSFRNTLGTCGLKAKHKLKPSYGGSTSHSSAQSPKAKPVGQAASSPPVGGSSSTDVVVMVTVVSIMGSWEVEKLPKTMISNHWFTTRTIHKAMLLHRPYRKRSQGVKHRGHWYTGFYIWSDVIARWRIGSLSLQTKICCIISWLPAAKLPWSWSWLWPWWWSSWVWSCSPSSWLWSSSCCPWQCWIQRAFLGSNVFRYWQTRSETNTWSTQVNRINLLKS